MPFNARRSKAQIPEITRLTVVGEEVFIPLTQKNLTTGGANKGSALCKAKTKIFTPTPKQKGET